MQTPMPQDDEAQPPSECRRISEERRRIPEQPVWWRWIVIVCGASLITWMSIEDDHVLTAALLGASLSMVLVAHVLWGRFSGRIVGVVWLPLLGLLSGGLVGFLSALLAALLMLFKNAWHAHIFPDFPAALMLATVQRAPFWGLAGALIWVGCALAWVALGKNAPAKRT